MDNNDIHIYKCPNCGSHEVIEDGTDMICEHCSTRFKYNDKAQPKNTRTQTSAYPKNVPPTQVVAQKSNKSAIFVRLIVFTIFVGLIIACVKYCSAYNARYTVYNHKLMFPVSIKNEVYIFTISENSDTKKQMYILIDPKDKSVLKTGELKGIPTIKDIAYRKFWDEQIYLIVNNNSIFLLKPETESIENVTGVITDGARKATANKANSTLIKFINAEYGDGFEIHFKNGEQTSYYPAIDKAYSEDALYKATEANSSLEKIAKDSLFYVLCNTSKSTSSKSIAAINVKYNCGGPLNLISKAYLLDYPPNSHDVTKYRIISAKNAVKKNGLYDAAILHAKNDKILVKYRTSLDIASPQYIKLFDAKNNVDVWTIEGHKLKNYLDQIGLSINYIEPEKVATANDKYLLQYLYSEREFILIANNGKNITHISIDFTMDNEKKTFD